MPGVGEKVVLEDFFIVVDDVLLSAYEDEVGLITAESMVPDGSRAALFAVFGREGLPSGRQIVHTAHQQVFHYA